MARPRPSRYVSRFALAAFILFLARGKSDGRGKNAFDPRSASFGLGSSIIVLVMLTPALAKAADDKVTVGETEVVRLLPEGVKIPARIDTGAARTSLEARDLKVEKKVARFKLRDELGGLELTLPVIGWRLYKNPGSTDRRPVVEIEFCLGAKRFRTEANLNERSHLEFPMLIGRDVLEGNFVVDVSLVKTLPPSCDAGGKP